MTSPSGGQKRRAASRREAHLVHAPPPKGMTMHSLFSFIPLAAAIVAISSTAADIMAALWPERCKEEAFAKAVLDVDGFSA